MHSKQRIFRLESIFFTLQPHDTPRTFMKELRLWIVPLKSPRVVNPRASVPGPVVRLVHRAE